MAVTPPTLDVMDKTRVAVSFCSVVSVVLVTMSEEDSADGADAEVSAGVDAEEAPADGLNVAVRPHPSAAAPT